MIVTLLAMVPLEMPTPSAIDPDESPLPVPSPMARLPLIVLPIRLTLIELLVWFVRFSVTLEATYVPRVWPAFVTVNMLAFVSLTCKPPVVASVELDVGVPRMYRLLLYM